MMRPLQDWCFNASPTRIERLEEHLMANHRNLPFFFIFKSPFSP